MGVGFSMGGFENKGEYNIDEKKKTGWRFGVRPIHEKSPCKTDEARCLPVWGLVFGFRVWS